jgi:peptidoglycan pentaglycine glycine transferase (the first glycine)
MPDFRLVVHRSAGEGGASLQGLVPPIGTAFEYFSPPEEVTRAMNDPLVPMLRPADIPFVRLDGHPTQNGHDVRNGHSHAAGAPHAARNEAARVVEIVDPDHWNGLLFGRGDYELAQGWEWGEVQREAGCTSYRYAVLDGSACIAAVSVTCRQLPGLPYSVMYASRGPLLDWNDTRAWQGLLPAIRRIAERHRAIFFRVSPAVAHDAVDARMALSRHGFRPIADDWTTWNAARIVLTLGLDGDEEALVARFRKGIRRDLAAAQRRGARVRVARDRADLLAFHRLTATAGREKGYPVRPLARLEALWDAYVARGDGVVLLAEHEGGLLGGVLGLRFGRRAYLHRATILRASEGQRLHQGPLVYWEFIRWAKAAGCDVIDLGGSGTRFPPSESDEGHGVYQFKSGFGADLQYWLPYHDLIFRPRLYRLARAAETWILPHAWRLRALLNH